VLGVGVAQQGLAANFRGFPAGVSPQRSSPPKWVAGVGDDTGDGGEGAAVRLRRRRSGDAGAEGISTPAVTTVGTLLARTSLTSRSSRLFAKGSGLLNKGPLRIGWGWMGKQATGTNVFRIGVGPARTTHINIGMYR
jgi:hypothetical protein